MEAGELPQQQRRMRGKTLASAIAFTAALATVCLVTLLAFDSTTPTVLDDAVQDPLERQLNFGSDEPAYEWQGANADGYDAEKQNVWAEDGAFDEPDGGHSEKSMATALPSEETNVLDYLPSGTFTEPKSMELRQLEGPADPPENVWDNMPLDY